MANDDVIIIQVNTVSDKWSTNFCCFQSIINRTPLGLQQIVISSVILYELRHVF